MVFYRPNFIDEIDGEFMRVNSSLILAFAVGFFVLSGVNVQAAPIYTYNELAVKDIEQMSKLINSKIADSKGAEKPEEPLKDGLLALISRPNSDNLISKLITNLKNELENYDGFEAAVMDLVKEATAGISDKRNDSKVQATYWIFLENLMSEFRPKVSEPFEKSIYEKIRDAKIKITKEALAERRLTVMSVKESPSDIAEKVLKDLEEAQKKLKK